MFYASFAINLQSFSEVAFTTYNVLNVLTLLVPGYHNLFSAMVNDQKIRI